MITYPLSSIAPRHYDAFRRICNRHIPNAYDEWLKFMAEKRTDVSGHDRQVVDVEVEPDEFSRYLATTGHEPTYEILRNYVATKYSRDTKR